MLFQRQPSWHGSSLSQMPRGRRPHHQSKFYTACLRLRAGQSSAVFAQESPTRSAGFGTENGLYLFALTVPLFLLDQDLVAGVSIRVRLLIELYPTRVAALLEKCAH